MFDLVRSPNTVALSPAIVLKEIRLKSIDNEFFRSVTPEIIEKGHNREKYSNNIEKFMSLFALKIALPLSFKSFCNFLSNETVSIFIVKRLRYC